MADDFDRAQDLEMAERAAMIARTRDQATHVTFSHCQDCGEAIPKARQMVKGVKRCIGCQTLVESKSARGLK